MVVRVETSELAMLATENERLKARVVVLEAQGQNDQQQLAQLIADYAALSAEVARLKGQLAKDGRKSR